MTGTICAIGTELIIIFLLILANGVFAMSEIAVVAARKVRLQQRAEEGDERAKTALALAHDPNQFLSTVQFGITLVGVLAGAYGGATIAAQLAVPIADGPGWRPTPKASRSARRHRDHRAVADRRRAGAQAHRAQQSRSDRLVGRAADDVAVAHRRPVVALLTASTNLVLRVFGIKGEAEPNLTEDEIRALISQGAETGAVGAAEENIVQRVFQLGDQRVAAIMTPRPDIEWIDVDATRRRAARVSRVAFAHAVRGLPRRPRQRARHRALGGSAADRVQGQPIGLRSLTREALFVPDSMPAVQLLESFRWSHKHVALVMDEYGAVEGLVTVTDLLTAIVGDLPADASEAQGAFVGARRRLVAGRRLGGNGRGDRRISASTRCRKTKPARITPSADS